MMVASVVYVSPVDANDCDRVTCCRPTVVNICSTCLSTPGGKSTIGGGVSGWVGEGIITACMAVVLRSIDPRI